MIPKADDAEAVEVTEVPRGRATATTKAKATTTESPSAKAASATTAKVQSHPVMADDERAFKPKTEQEWLDALGAEAYRVMRQNGTERPFSSPLHQTGHQGEFLCKGCGTKLFDASAQFGWGSLQLHGLEKARSCCLDTTSLDHLQKTEGGDRKHRECNGG